MSETQAVAEWLYAKLTGDVQLNGVPVFEEPSPSEASFPRITFSQNVGGEVQGHNGITVMYDGLWLVKGIDRYSSFSRLEVIADRITQLLHRQSGQVPAGAVLYCIRQEPIRLADVTNGISYRHLGFLFKIGAQ